MSLFVTLAASLIAFLALAWRLRQRSGTRRVPVRVIARRPSRRRG